MVGKVFPTKRGGDCVVVDYQGTYKVKVAFLDSFGYETTVEMVQIRRGDVKNLYAKTNYGVGYIGEGCCKPYYKGIRDKSYTAWNGALRRCYDLGYIEKYPTYEGCSVEDYWHNLQNFSLWHKSQKFSSFDYHLDKDILVNNNKIYSESTCCLVPKEINLLLTNNFSARGDYPQGVTSNGANRFIAQSRKPVGGSRYLGTYDTQEEAFFVYKTNKEIIVKDTAIKFRDRIDKNVFEALMNWTLD